MKYVYLKAQGSTVVLKLGGCGRYSCYVDSAMKEFDDAAAKLLFDLCDKDECKKLVISGMDPMSPEYINDIFDICVVFRIKYKFDKFIRISTEYDFDEVKKSKLAKIIDEASIRVDEGPERGLRRYLYKKAHTVIWELDLEEDSTEEGEEC